MHRRRDELDKRNNDSDQYFRYGYHVPRTNARDNFYNKLEEQRAAENAQ
jgi:hypothetical protein